MSSGKPDVILRKYRSILFSALAVELTTFIVSLLDPIIAGNRIGIGALSAISLFSPFISFSTFVAAVINTGTLVNYTLMIGKFQKKRANEIFSQGMIMVVSAGVMMTLIILLVKPLFISSRSPPAEVEGYLNRYYNIAAFYPLLFPTNCILNNIIVTEGGEKHAAISNICCIVGNIIFSFRLAGIFGIMGIAAATLASKQFDLSDLSTEEHSFLQYIVERLMTVTDHSAYFSTTGYNRNEMVFKENKIS